MNDKALSLKKLTCNRREFFDFSSFKKFSELWILENIDKPISDTSSGRALVCRNVVFFIFSMNSEFFSTDIKCSPMTMKLNNSRKFPTYLLLQP